jgi:hypothetical protein
MTARKPAGEHIDALMEQASVALVKRQYFLCERLAAECLTKSLVARDYQRASRVINPLQEARRHKRDLAWDTGRVTLLHEPLVEGFKVEAGCYVLVPPRVGQDARTLRTLADQAEVPVVIVAREPKTSSGQCPVVAIGPVTVRAYVPEPAPAAPAPAPKAKKPAKGKAAPASAPAPAPAPGLSNAFGAFTAPDRAWVLLASELLGDAAIAQVTVTNPFARAEELHLRLQSHPDHEKLHQRLREACEEAARELLINPDAIKRTTAVLDEEALIEE